MRVRCGSSAIAAILVLAAASLAGPASGGSLVNGGFESGGPGLALPDTVGLWSGDIANAVAAENGITPFEGSAMLRFDAAFFNCTMGGGSSDVWQLVLVPAFAGQAVVSARFNRVDLDPDTDTQFQIGVRAFAGSPSGFDDFEPAVPSSLTAATSSLFSDADLGTWEEISAEIEVPADAGYVGVLISAVENVSNESLCPIGEFDGHYADAVELTFVPATPALPAWAAIATAGLLAVASRWALRRRSTRA